MKKQVEGNDLNLLGKFTVKIVDLETEKEEIFKIQSIFISGNGIRVRTTKILFDLQDKDIYLQFNGEDLKQYNVDELHCDCNLMVINFYLMEF